MVGRVLATRLQLGRGLRSPEVLVAVAPRDDQESARFGPPAASAAASAAGTADAAVLDEQGLGALERVPADLGPGLALRRAGDLHAGEEPDVARVAVRYA